MNNQQINESRIYLIRKLKKHTFTLAPSSMFKLLQKIVFYIQVKTFCFSALPERLSCIDEKLVTSDKQLDKLITRLYSSDGIANSLNKTCSFLTGK